MNDIDVNHYRFSFVKNKEDYNARIDVLGNYVQQLRVYLKKRYKLSEDSINRFIQHLFTTRFKDKTVKHFIRDENGDRRVDNTSLLAYIKDSVSNREVISPTFTTYTASDRKRSLIADFVDINAEKRGIAKKEAQKAKANNQMDLFTAKNNEQNMLKLYNNSISGSFAQEQCILHNPTAHSTLTSITRTITSLSNASNEKLIAGNRLLTSIDDVLNHCTYIITYANLDLIEKVINKYQLKQISSQDLKSVLMRSLSLYFFDEYTFDKKLLPFLDSLTDIERSAIAYIGDLYHIRQFNGSFVKTFLKELTTKKPVENDVQVDDIYKLDANVMNFVHQIYFSDVKGHGKDYAKMKTIGLLNDLYGTAVNVEKTLFNYSDFIHAFFITDLFPNNSNKLSSMIRRTVVLSDTDSTCFSLDEWVKWDRGEFYIDDESIALTGAIAFLASQTIAHQLALLSTYMNVSKDSIFKLAMKNEYLWLIHDPAEVSKHYFAYTVMQEGSVYKEPSLEYKGVHLKNSAVPVHINSIGKELMLYITKTLTENRPISLSKILKTIVTLENHIEESVKKGESIYLKKTKIKDKTAYALEEDKSPYQRHTFWNTVFGPKYGFFPDPPYDVVKFPSTITSVSKLNAWLETIDDLDLKERLILWLKQNAKKDMPTFYISDDYVLGNGVPKELLQVVDIKRIILDVTIQFRIILESLGIVLEPELTIKEQFNISE